MFFYKKKINVISVIYKLDIQSFDDRLYLFPFIVLSMAPPPSLDNTPNFLLYAVLNLRDSHNALLQAHSALQIPRRTRDLPLLCRVWAEMGLSGSASGFSPNTCGREVLRRVNVSLLSGAALSCSVQPSHTKCASSCRTARIHVGLERRVDRRSRTSGGGRARVVS